MELENDIDLERELSQIRHKELISALRLLTDEFRKTPPEDGYKKTIESHIQSVNELVKALVNMPKPTIPEVNVAVNNEGVVMSIKDIASKIEMQMDVIRKCVEYRPVDMNFTVVRNPAGFITNVIVKST